MEENTFLIICYKLAFGLNISVQKPPVSLPDVSLPPPSVNPALPAARPTLGTYSYFKGF